MQNSILNRPVRFFPGKSSAVFVAFLFLIAGMDVVSGQQVDYQKLFGDDWKKALDFEKENRAWMEPVLRRNHITYPMAIAVIFPELVRYSALRDKMEITLLKALYINLGEEYANFSVGRFQMKPSFASLVRLEAPGALGRRSGITFAEISEYDDIKDYRKSLIADLEDVRIEFNYFVAFYKLCEKKFNLKKLDELSRLRFISTAYNYGPDRSAEQIESMKEKKFFSTRLLPAETYCYADVSVFWYLYCFKAENP
jgi:hypothetical protein